METTTTESISLLGSVKSFEDARKLFPVAESCTYLDSAHYSQYSLETRRRLVEFIDEFTFTNKNLSLFNFKISESLKEKCAELIGADKDDIIITSSTTHGLNIFANGVVLNKGDYVAYADSEFPAIVYPWMNQEKLRGINNVMIPSKNGQIKEEDIEKVIKEYKVKVLTISSVEFLGFRNDLRSISKICKDNDCLFVVDAIQGTGVCPLNVKDMNIDFFSAGSQKWLMAPAGIGFAYISPRIKEKVNPTYVATSSIEYDFKNFLDYKLNFRKDGAAYENSTLNTLGMIGLESSIELFLKLGVDNIFNHILKLQDVFIQEMKGSDFRIESDQDPVHRSNILIFSHIDNSRNESIQKYLENENIFIALREGFLRLAAHVFNNEDDILKLTASLKKM
ncbi:MAG: aminotransferase class V-fold PLP-dependent enzyme [Ignavibacteria bacterium]|nr:aminotransferase class V-fold PLP-dependent enzyme [Ignavibacteria bacterium]